MLAAHWRATAFVESGLQLVIQLFLSRLQLRIAPLCVPFFNGRSQAVFLKIKEKPERRINADFSPMGVTTCKKSLFSFVERINRPGDNFFICDACARENRHETGSKEWLKRRGDQRLNNGCLVETRRHAGEWKRERVAWTSFVIYLPAYPLIPCKYHPRCDFGKRPEFRQIF